MEGAAMKPWHTLALHAGFWTAVLAVLLIMGD